MVIQWCVQGQIDRQTRQIPVDHLRQTISLVMTSPKVIVALLIEGIGTLDKQVEAVLAAKQPLDVFRGRFDVLAIQKEASRPVTNKLILISQCFFDSLSLLIGDKEDPLMQL